MAPLATVLEYGFGSQTARQGEDEQTGVGSDGRSGFAAKDVYEVAESVTVPMASLATPTPYLAAVITGVCPGVFGLTPSPHHTIVGIQA